MPSNVINVSPRDEKVAEASASMPTSSASGNIQRRTTQSVDNSIRTVAPNGDITIKFKTGSTAQGITYLTPKDLKGVFKY
jgi:hypothetical protein